jgi:hypothetical protein
LCLVEDFRRRKSHFDLHAHTLEGPLQDLDYTDMDMDRDTQWSHKQ